MKYSKALIETICKSLKQGCTITATCQAAGIHRDSLYGWMEKNSDISDIIKKAQASAIKEVENTLLKMATGKFKYIETHEEQIIIGKKKTPAVLKKRIHKTLLPPVGAVVFYLANRHPDEWKNLKETKLSGTVTGEIKAEDIWKAWEEAKKQKEEKEKKNNATHSRIKSKGKG